MTEVRTPLGTRAAVLFGTAALAVGMIAPCASAQDVPSKSPGQATQTAPNAAVPDTGGAVLQPPAGGGERWSLARCVATALTQNVDARSAHARTVQARGGALGAWRGVLPTVSAGLVYNHLVPDKQSSIFFVDSVAFLTKRQQQQGASAGMDANLLSLPAWSEKRRQDHLRKGAEESEAETRNGVVFSVKQQYFDLLKSERLADVSRESERLARDEETRADALFQVGTVARGDVLKARARRAQTQLDRIRAVNQVEIQRSKLKQMLGLKPESALEIEGLLDENIALPDSANAVEKALKGRPELSRTGAVERAARSGLFSARARRLPQITGSVGVDRTKNTNRLEQLGVAEFDDTHYATVWRGSVQLSLPIFDGFALEGGMKSAKGALLEAEAQHRQRELDVAVEVQQSWLSLREAVERIGVAKEGLASAEEDYKFSKGRYDLGAGTILDLLNAEVSLAQAKQSYVESLADAHVAEAALERAIGERRY